MILLMRRRLLRAEAGVGANLQLRKLRFRAGFAAAERSDEGGQESQGDADRGGISGKPSLRKCALWSVRVMERFFSPGP